MSWEIEINESIEERIARDGYSSLSESERVYHGVWWLLFVAYGPGLVQYFHDTPAEWVAAARRGLGVIDASNFATLFEEAMSLLPKDIPADTASREALIDRLTEAQQDALNEVSNRLTDLRYPDKLLKRYADSNDNSFSGPRTKLELWRSKHARGVDTTPRYVTKKMDFAVEAEKDKPYSTRSCPVCGYPSPDYRPRCKRCDFPHGKAEPSAGGNAR